MEPGQFELGSSAARDFPEFFERSEGEDRFGAIPVVIAATGVRNAYYATCNYLWSIWEREPTTGLAPDY